MPYIAHFTNLKELNLEDNYIDSLPDDLSSIFPAVENLNLNGNNFEEDQFEQIIDSLATMPNLKSLFINLHEEEQVDLVMKKMVYLEFLNGLPVEREEEEEEEEQQPPLEDLKRFEEMRASQNHNPIDDFEIESNGKNPTTEPRKAAPNNVRLNDVFKSSDTNLLNDVNLSDMNVLSSNFAESEPRNKYNKDLET